MQRVVSLRSGAGEDLAEGPPRLAELGQRRLTEMILSGALPGGTTVVEGRLAERLAISRTPMREALLRLEGAGLLVKGSGRSYVVRTVDAGEFFQSMKVRELLEPEVVALAHGRVPAAELEEVRRLNESVDPADAEKRWNADNALHDLFARHGGNAVMARVIREMRITARLFEGSDPFRRGGRDGEEHRAILAAFADGSPTGARRAMRRHLRNVQRDVLRRLQGR
jgi:DNA-binding GntR family transcriptional regulator